jgi:hypothetical protein
MGLDRIVQLAQKQKQKICNNTLNNTQKMVNEPLNMTMNVDARLSNNSSALCIQMQKASIGQLAKLQDFPK